MKPFGSSLQAPQIPPGELPYGSLPIHRVAFIWSHVCLYLKPKAPWEQAACLICLCIFVLLIAWHMMFKGSLVYNSYPPNDTQLKIPVSCLRGIPFWWSTHKLPSTHIFCIPTETALSPGFTNPSDSENAALPSRLLFASTLPLIHTGALKPPKKYH